MQNAAQRLFHSLIHSLRTFSKATLGLALLLSLAGLASCGSGKPDGTRQAFGTAPRAEIEGINDLAFLLRNYSQGKSSHPGWAGYWWPYLENGIADAASKYEQATGQIGAVNWELTYHSAGAPGGMPWFGHCNGWAAASVLFDEPRSDLVQNGVHFSVSDQKALLSELGQEVHLDAFGLRADTDSPGDPAFDDIYPNQFFLVLTNLVGKGQSLIMDRYTGSQVWNHPIAGYRVSPVTPSDYLGADPSAPGVYRVMLTTQLWWLRDDVPPGQLTEPFNFADGPSYDSRILRFEVWTDAPAQFDDSGNLVNAGKVVLTHEGNVVYGGAWQMGGSDVLNSHPDYLWAPYSLATPGQYANPGIDSQRVKTLLKL
jgi:hypothetical protein